MTTKKTTGRGRPRSFDLEAALATAQTLFQQRGYDGVGVAEIGQALGISPPSFYNAFGSKAALFARILDRYEASYGQFVPDALEGPGNIGDAIERVLLAAAVRYARRDGIAGCLVLDGARGSQDAEAVTLTAAHKAASLEMLATRIARELPDRATELAWVVTIALNGLSASARDGADEAALTAFARVAARAFRDEVARVRH
jgi:TetR/AcrR family transcriptional repressor for divergent bdcA